VLFARLASKAASPEDEARFFDLLEAGGVRLGRRAWYGGVERSFGWTGIGFGVRSEVMEAAVRRMERVLLEGGLGKR